MFFFNWKTILAFSASLTLITSVAQAQGANIGEAEYVNNCATCHGTSGKGDGPMAGIINQLVPDLTTLQKDSDGVFPFARVYDVIDGRTTVAAHGTRDMPVWGSEYNADAPQMLGFDYSGDDAEAFIRGRILALIGHIYTLQAQ